MLFYTCSTVLYIRCVGERITLGLSLVHPYTCIVEINFDRDLLEPRAQPNATEVKPYT